MFFSGRSSTYNLFITQFLSEYLVRRGQIDVIYTDVSKRFDQIDHDIIYNKLTNIGFSHNAVDFFK